MGRHSSCVKQKLRKGLWSPEEDEKLFNYIIKFGVGCWSSVPKHAGLQRCGKSCRLRWINYLRPDLKRGTFSPEEENIILSLHEVLGNRWAQIAAKLPGRTDNEIKNYWNSCLKKKLIKQGIDPNTHKPIITETMIRSSSSSSDVDIDHHNHKSSVLPIVNFSAFSEIEQVLRTEPQQHQAFDPLFMYDTQCQQNYNNLFDRDQYCHSYNTMPSLASFDLSDEKSNSGTSYILASNNEASAAAPGEISSSNNSCNNNKVNTCFEENMNNSMVMMNGPTFPIWETTCENKIDSLFQFPFGIKCEDVEGCSWHEGKSSDDFSDYSLPNLPQDLSGQNIEYFMPSTKFNI